MGMFDTVRCRYPLPHHQDEEFQTKDLAYLVLGETVGGLLDDYEITEDGRLMRHVHEREWRDDPDSFAEGYLESVRDWWEEAPDVHGDVRIYTSEFNDDEADQWIEFYVRFSDGRVQEVRDSSRPLRGS